MRSLSPVVSPPGRQQTFSAPQRPRVSIELGPRGEEKKCPPVSTWELQQAKELLRYGRKRTQDDPFFAVVTGALHGGPVEFTKQQPFVEKATAAGARALTPDGIAEEILGTSAKHPDGSEEKAAQLWRSRSPVLRDGARCYVRMGCDREPDLCLSPEGRETLILCMQERGGIGKKTADLMREYLGDDDAVAVDRHVAGWLDEIGATIRTRDGKPFPFRKGENVSDEHYDLAVARVTELALDCAITPAEVQVGAWIHGACNSLGRSPLFVGTNKFIQCGERESRRLEQFGLEIPVPKEGNRHGSVG